MLKAAFIDIDGTLVDSNELHVLAWAHAFAHVNHAIPREAIRKQVGKGADMLIPALLPSSRESLRSAIDSRQSAFFQTHGLPAVRPFPGAGDFVKALAARGVRVILASSASAKEVHYYVELMDLTDVVDIICADDVERSKPAGDIFAKALTKVAPLPAESCIAIGDSPYDVQSAARCGIKTIALRTGPFSDQELRSSGAFAIEDDISASLKYFLNAGEGS